MHNFFNNIPTSLEHELIESLVDRDCIKIERIISKGHKSPATGWYDQDNDEWVMVLQGKATLAFEDAPSITLAKGDYVEIEAHRKHKVVWTDPCIETIWLAVHYL